jgi:prepilin-type N-terminal cleavage/methylation domain-containing protein
LSPNSFGNSTGETAKKMLYVARTCDKFIKGSGVRSRGFTLIEILITVVMMGFLLTALTTLIVAARTASIAKETPAALRDLDAVLVAYVMTQRRLPCPADGALPSTSAQYGLERRDGSGDCINNQQRGVVPWRTLGMKDEQAIDGYGNLITYRVALGLARSEAMNYTGCDPIAVAGASRVPPVITTASGTAPYQTCNPVCPAIPVSPCCNMDRIASECTVPSDATAGKGFVVQDIAGSTVTSGVAYVLISHGANRAGAYQSGGAAAETVGTAPSAAETQNASTGALATFYVSDQVREATSNHFDDMVVWRPIFGLAQAAHTGPRPH